MRVNLTEAQAKAIRVMAWTTLGTSAEFKQAVDEVEEIMDNVIADFARNRIGKEGA